MPEPVAVFIGDTIRAQPRVKGRIQRHKSDHKKDFVQIYTPATAKEWKAAVAACVEGFGKLRTRIPVALEMTFFFARPQSHHRSGRFSHLLKEDAPKWHVKKPDVDNLSKAVMDAMEGAKALLADEQVVDLHIRKKWLGADNPDEGLFLTFERLAEEE